MMERSQGCQTFISFLLTIGAEAKHGVIKNTLLLLDEPETHLHPSGVRFMLQELISAARNGNNVVFATHSIFMIDSEKYERHVIVKKSMEQTDIQPSRKDQIGYFMQEEVLYSALNFDIAGEFGTREKYNFVFEGSGDAVIFEAFYNRALRKADRPFDCNKSAFYQGGKCSDILKYFKQKPIQLGSIWIFILDGDEPANQLREFLYSRYEDFIGKYVFVFQYDVDGTNCELEDLVPLENLGEIIHSSLSECGHETNLAVAKEGELFAEYFEKIVEQVTDKKVFKPRVKEGLNLWLRNTSKKIKKMEDIEELMPAYAHWANKVVANLSNSDE